MSLTKVLISIEGVACEVGDSREGAIVFRKKVANISHWLQQARIHSVRGPKPIGL